MRAPTHLTGRGIQFQTGIGRSLRTGVFVAVAHRWTGDSIARRGDRGHPTQHILWQPLKALDISAITDTLRDIGSSTIVKAQAYTYAGETDKGVKYAIRGLEMARQYQSKRHISRIQGMYDRLSVTPPRRSATMKELHAALGRVCK
ncbi:hypothetical protein KDW_41310 [Dictyobacter vulcani]|uniref:Uncharacterized protein n=1 Tax=Dictyobacter vulcani TaxID=2607529 RepID=A0A5J4KV46_9CHLR|nr:hypothetical protein KDW_41310 [Dictyobacter vulcani]